tara:strand:+ start:1806 stop:2432 length:627 start_codon:yes stop_codon:yes gene_type:complete
MPYSAERHLLFIHIPKTGGSSVERFLGIMNKQSLYSGGKNNILPTTKLRNLPLQHLTYKTLYTYRNVLNIDFNNILKIFTIVRCPYTRILSDLFFYKLIRRGDTPSMVYNKLRHFIRGSPQTYNNHNIPQYQFLIDTNGEIVKKITVLKFENLKQNLINYGFENFNVHLNKNKTTNNKNYIFYLNKNSIRLINTYYKLDFLLFGYTMA